MQSCLYECQVMHHRFSPREHRFVYRIFLVALDLDELDAVHQRLRLFSVNRPNLYSFRERDHLPTFTPAHNASASTGKKCHVIRDTSPARPSLHAAPSLKQRVIDHLATHGIDLTGGRVVLITLPRIFGYLFKPVSFYFCYDRAGRPTASIAEVTNTFHELKPYVLGPETHDSEKRTFQLRVPKHFYVSPFSDVDVAFDFNLHTPGERLSVRIDDYEAMERTLATTLAGPRRPLTDAALASFIFKYPLLTLRVIVLIHWHALRLWFKRVPWFAKAARAGEQRNLYHPHASLIPPASAPAAAPQESVT
jgi:uncharacterized protein